MKVIIAKLNKLRLFVTLLQALRNVDFFFDKIFGNEESSGHSETIDTVNLSYPVFAVKPSLTSFNFLRDHFVLSKSRMSSDEPTEFVRMQKKAIEIFVMYGMNLTSSNVVDANV